MVITLETRDGGIKINRIVQGMELWTGLIFLG